MTVKFLKLAVAVAVLFLAGCVRTGVVLPTETVRIIRVGESQMCSAVVIRPGVALTARHCLSQGITVDGKPVAFVVAPMDEGKDIAVISAPGLECPCALVGRRPAVGDKIVAVGFPGGAEGRQDVSAGTVRAVGSVAEIAPWIAEHPLAAHTFILSDVPMLEGGESGGGLFAVQDGKWRLVGINVIGVPSAPMYGAPELASGFTPLDFAPAVRL
jgi:S1-C subfamily serine protease